MLPVISTFFTCKRFRTFLNLPGGSCLLKKIIWDIGDRLDSSDNEDEGGTNKTGTNISLYTLYTSYTYVLSILKIYKLCLYITYIRCKIPPSLAKFSDPHSFSQNLGISCYHKSVFFCHVISYPIFKSSKWWNMPYDIYVPGAEMSASVEIDIDMFEER